LEALVADLDSVDAAEEEVRPLRDLVAELGRTGSDRAGLEGARERALAVLEAFAAPGGSTAGGSAGDRGRDPGFWKR
jgi:hypothetical protein